MSKNIINSERYQYVRTVINDGRRKYYSKDNGDPVAVALRGLTKDELLEVVKENKMDKKYEDYAETKSAGHFRMIVGQHIRFRWKRGDAFTIRGVQLPVFTDKSANKPDA